MPELPEVETIKNILEPIVKGHTITSIDVLRDCTIVGDQNEFISTMTGKTFKSISRIGKFLIFHLSDDVVMISHLRMEGKYFELDETSKNTYFCRMVFHLNNGKKICYDDSRCFGMMKVSTENEYMSVKDIAQLGPEPFDVTNVQYLIDRTKRTGIAIKTVLMDQTLMCGIGNIYADEILYASKIHPLTPAKLIRKEEWENILENAKKILKQAMELGGSTIRSYHPGKNIDGKFQSRLLAYGHQGQKCSRCGGDFFFVKVNGRGTTFCPHCQAKRGAPIKVAIFGKIASGKSTVLKQFKEAKIPTISCDEIVKELYTRPELVKKINKTFSIPGDEINKDLLRKTVQNPINKKKLENIVHPLVRLELEKFLSQKKDILVAEVPLLYEAEMEDLFDVAIAIDIDQEIQVQRLFERNGKTAKDLSALNNMNSKFDENKKKAEFVISNNSDLSSLSNQIKEVISKLEDRLN